MKKIDIIKVRLMVCWWCIFAPAKYREYKKIKRMIKKAFEDEEIRRLLKQVHEKVINERKEKVNRDKIN